MTIAIDPSATALLVMDLQNAILGRVPDAEALLDRAVRAIAIARAKGIHVGHVRVAFEPADVAKVPPTNPTFFQFAPMFPADAPATQFHERVAPQEGDIVVRKTRVGAFSTTDLAEQLAARGVTTLVLAGVATSGVVLSTVREAADRDYRLIVLADACADADEEVHRVLIEKVLTKQAEVVGVEAWGAARRSPP